MKSEVIKPFLIYFAYVKLIDDHGDFYYPKDFDDGEFEWKNIFWRFYVRWEDSIGKYSK